MHKINLKMDWEHLGGSVKHPTFFFLKISFIYSTEVETASERGNTSRGSGRGRSRLPTEEPDVGFDPRTPGSRPELKAVV